MIRRIGGYLTVRSEPAPDASRQLEREGYTVLRDVLSAKLVSELHADVARVFEGLPGDERSQRRTAHDDDMFRYEMLNRSAKAQQMVAHPKILQTIEPLLGEDCHVIANTAWRNPAGQPGMHGGQGWHIDAGPHVPLPEGTRWPENIPHPVFAIGVHVFLEDCNLEDGPTGVIPGSHLSGRFPPTDRRMDNDLDYMGQKIVPLPAKAGDVAMFVSDIWHRRMPTTDDDSGRFFLQIHYGRRDIAQRLKTTAQLNQLSDEAMARAIEQRQRTVVGLHPAMFYDG
ncbi:MAG: phytanoyl-CoA dioxygenase family protein [Pseudomonadales bacterium]